MLRTFFCVLVIAFFFFCATSNRLLAQEQVLDCSPNLVWSPSLRQPEIGSIIVDQKGNAYLIDQLILTGSSDAITTLINSNALTLLDTIRLGDNAPIFPNGEIALVQVDSDDLNQRIIELYEKQATSAISDPKSLVFIDPNYLTGRSIRSRTLSLSGDPHAIGAHPFGPAFSSSGAAAPFLYQWAFSGKNGIHVRSDMTNPETQSLLNDEAGTQTFVYLFDTSPFLISGGRYIPIESPKAISKRMSLCVWNFPEDHLDVSAPEHYEPIPGHGLFGATMAYGVSPYSKFHLVRVLDAQAQGTAFTLLKAMNVVFDALLDRKAVFNLSLGIEQHSDPIAGAQSELLESLKVWNTFDELSQGKCLDGKFRYYNYSFATMLCKVRSGQNVVVVASAGNDSIRSMTLPSAHPGVIGVSASDYDGNIACYSNLGDVSAPGGDPNDFDTNGREICDASSSASKYVQCQGNPSECPYGVIGLNMYTPTISAGKLYIREESPEYSLLPLVYDMNDSTAITNASAFTYPQSIIVDLGYTSTITQLGRLMTFRPHNMECSRPIQMFSLLYGSPKSSDSCTYQEWLEEWHRFNIHNEQFYYSDDKKIWQVINIGTIMERNVDGWRRYQLPAHVSTQYIKFELEGDWQTLNEIEINTRGFQLTTWSFWTGTSFSAPQVAGLAAQALACGIDATDVTKYILDSPQRVSGEKIVDANELLKHCP